MHNPDVFTLLIKIVERTNFYLNFKERNDEIIFDMYIHIYMYIFIYNHSCISLVIFIYTNIYLNHVILIVLYLKVWF